MLSLSLHPGFRIIPPPHKRTKLVCLFCPKILNKFKSLDICSILTEQRNQKVDTLEFFLNECHWIQQIKWIMTKSKKSRVTTSNTYLDIVTLPVIVIQSTFSLLPLGGYLLPLTTLNRYLSRHSSKDFIFTTSSENIAITRCGVFLITISILWFIEFRQFSESQVGKTQLCLFNKLLVLASKSWLIYTFILIKHTCI